MKSLLFAALLATSSLAGANGDTVLAGIHGLERVGNHLCMTDMPFNTWHYHYGSGTTLEEAIDSWESFTKWEYGPRFHNFANAHQAQVSCSELSDGGQSCTASGIPCR